MKIHKVAVVTAPSIEPVTLAEAKTHLRVPSTYTDEDDLISSLITTARLECENETDRAMITTTLDCFLDGFPYYLGQDTIQRPRQRIHANAIDFPVAAVLSIVSVKYYDLSGTLQTLDPSVYIAGLGTPGVITPAYLAIWPIAQERIDAVVIRITAGYGPTAASVPECVKAAIKLRVGDLYENREASGLSWIQERVLDPVRWRM